MRSASSREEGGTVIADNWLCDLGKYAAVSFGTEEVMGHLQLIGRVRRVILRISLMLKDLGVPA